jgi:hypothetical protein
MLQFCHTNFRRQHVDLFNFFGRLAAEVESSTLFLGLAMGDSSNYCGKRRPLTKLVLAVTGALALTACGGSDSYQTAAMDASSAGDQKAATSLAKKEVARYATPDQCSMTAKLNCGTLALAYGTLASYQIMDGDRTAGEESFISAKGALSLTDPAIRASATAMVYRDVSEAFWKTGDRSRAVAVFKEGSAAGADQYLYMSSAARFTEQQRQQEQQQQAPPDQQPDKGPATAGGNSTAVPEAPQKPPAAPGPNVQGPNTRTTTRTAGTGTARPPLQPTPLQPTR